ncbi:MAG: replication-associated recombination protein A [Acidimicrobiia bacterium]|jgi:putative ATPase|nr:replication-associated recombination protein A [Acidimicrobiia bacterium]MBP8179759.1 replication-associated recombination protein A [Acidimicrobiia bacterium]
MPSAVDLFTESAEVVAAENAPLAARLRPKSLDDVVGQDHLLAPGRPLAVLVKRDAMTSVVFWGPPGTGKTSVAQLIAKESSFAFVALSAVTTGVAEVRAEVAAAKRRLGEQGQRTLLFLDEIHRFNRSQQDALLPHVESGVITLVGATTENPSFSLNAALLSRSLLFQFRPLTAEAVSVLLDRGIELLGVPVSEDARGFLIDATGGDARSALHAYETSSHLAAGNGRAEVTVDDVEAALETRPQRYGPDAHYDVISAFIKSIRGSDTDAALYWLATMLEAGEDPRFIARRLVISASEDVGMADSRGLLVADAAFNAVERIGLPEARINLAHATVYLSRAPKSNRAYVALGEAQEAVRQSPNIDVPLPLRDGSSSASKRAGHGQGYKYPHDDPTGWVAQDYLPQEVKNQKFYRPTSHGAEARAKVDWWRIEGDRP